MFIINVAKFGGSSVANAIQFKKVGSIIKENPKRKFIIVSAPGKRNLEDIKVTDTLIKLGTAFVNNRPYDQYLTALISRFEEIIIELAIPDSTISDIYQLITSVLESKKADEIIFEGIKAIGEDSSARILNAYLNSIGLQSTYINPKEAGIIVSNEPGNAQLLPESMDKLYRLRDREGILVIPGFFGYTKNNQLVTFSRGGSDITGAIVAAGVKADLYENFTDVDSVYTVNPKIVNNPKRIKKLTYKEMRELSYAGFSVFHDEALIPAFEANVPVCIKNTNNPTAPGTMIVSNKKPTEKCVVGIASDVGFCSLYVSKFLMNRELGFGRKLFSILEDEEISFEHAPSGIDDMTIILREDQLNAGKEKIIVERIKNELKTDTVKIERDLAMIMVVGEGMKSTVGMAQMATTALANAKINIEMINQGSSEVSMMFGIQAKQLNDAIQSLYSTFFSQK